MQAFCVHVRACVRPQELREFQAKEKALAEEKAQRVTQLEQELRTLRQGVDETVAKFDDALVSLAAKHAAVAARIVAAESRMIGLVGAVDGVRRASDRIEAATLDKFGVRKEQQQRVGVELGEKRSLLAQLEARMAEVQGEERVLDRGFKKEFHDAERRYSDLLHLYKTRKEAVASPSPSPPAHAHHRSDQGEDRGHGGRARPSNTNRHSDSNQSVISHSTVGVARGSRAHDNTRHSMADGAAPTGAPPTVAGSVRVEGEGGSAAPPVHPLEAVLQHPYIKEAMANTQEPFPALPPAVANLIPSALMEFGGWGGQVCTCMLCRCARSLCSPSPAFSSCQAVPLHLAGAYSTHEQSIWRLHHTRSALHPLCCVTPACTNPGHPMKPAETRMFCVATLHRGFA